MNSLFPFTLRSRSFAACLIGFLAPAVAQSAVLVGPTDITVSSSVANVDAATINTVDLNGENELLITYSVTRGNLDAGSNWLTVGLNTGSGKFDFTNGGTNLFAGLIRTHTDTTDNHSAYISGAAETSGWGASGRSGVDFDAVSPNEHAARVTISGMSSGGFTGTKTVTFEIDHYASIFATADRTYTNTIDFGTTDIGLNIDFRSFGAGAPPNDLDPDHTVNNFTVSQIPEPSSLALVGLASVLLSRRRCR